MHLKGNRSLGNVYTASSIFLLLFHTEKETDFPFKRGRQQPPDKEEACVKGGRGTRRGGTGQKAEESRWRNEPLDLYINLYVTRRAQHTTYKGTGHRPAIVFGCSSSIMYFSLFQDAIHFFLLLSSSPFSGAAYRCLESALSISLTYVRAHRLTTATL